MTSARTDSGPRKTMMMMMMFRDAESICCICDDQPTEAQSQSSSLEGRTHEGEGFLGIDRSRRTGLLSCGSSRSPSLFLSFASHQPTLRVFDAE